MNKNSKINQDAAAYYDSLPHIIWVADPQGNHVYYNQSWYDYVQPKRAIKTAKAWDRIIHPQDRRSSMSVWEKSNKTKQPYEIKYRLKNGATGKYRWFMCQAKPVLNEQGEITEWWGTCLDVHEQELQLKEKDRSQKLAEFLFNSSPDSMKILRTDGTIESLNEQGKNLLETQKDTGILNQRWIDLWPEEVHADIKAALQHAAQGKTYRFIGQRPTATGDEHWWDVFISPIYNEDSVIDKYLVTARDITDLHDFQVQQQKFISVAAHEVKTPITVIENYIEMLEYTLKNTDDSRSLTIIKQLKHQVDRLNDLVGSVFDVSQLRYQEVKLKKQQYNLAAVVTDAIALVRPSLNNVTVGFKNKITAKCLAYCDKQKIEQIIVNLLTNANKYVTPNTEVLVTLRQTKKAYVVSVADKGPGIDKADLEKIFDINFRARSVIDSGISGSGMGLYICRQIAKLHQGSLTVKSSSKGSTFILKLPKEQ